MKKISTIIIDDEASAINTLSGMLLEYCPEISVVATSSTEEEAIIAISKFNPELVLLDIEMPPFSNGLDIISKFPERSFETIITSAHPQYAVTSVNAIQPCGYLIKPFSVEQLILSIRNAIAIIRSAVAKRPQGMELGIIVSDHRKGNVVVRYSEILYCKSEAACVSIIYASNGKEEKIVTYKSLKEIESNLPASFFRIHHSTIVNMEKIVRYMNLGRKGLVYLSSGKTLDVSVAKMVAFQESFNLFIGMRN